MAALSTDELTDDVDLVFREQVDGRKVSRLPTGKVVLVALEHVAKVKDGERWLVRLDHRETFAVAHPLEKLAAAPAPMLRPVVRAPEPRPGPINFPIPSSAVKPAPLTPVASAAAAPTTPSSVVHAGDRVAIFVDGANMDGAARDAGFFIDWGKARRFCAAGGAFYAGFYFLADYTQTDPMQHRFLDFLSHSGYIVRKKPVKVIRQQDTGETQYKCNLDTEVVVELLNTAENYDVAFLFSGDSDYERVVDILRARGKRVYVVCSRHWLARELAYVADKPIFHLEDHRASLEREQPTTVT